MSKSIPTLLAFALVLGVACAGAAEPAKAGAQRIVLKSVKVSLPAGASSYPNSGSAQTSYCLMCHSTGMVMTQPPLSEAAWKGEVAKMRGTYGCPIPDDQVAAELASYFHSLNNPKK